MERWDQMITALGPPVSLAFFNTSLFFRCIIPCSASHPLGSLQQHDPTSTSSPASVSAKATSREAWRWRCGMFPSACPAQKHTVGMTESKCLNMGHLNSRSKPYSACTNGPDSRNLKLTAVRVCISIALKSSPSFKPQPKVVGTGSWGLQFYPSGFDEN